MQGMNWRVHRLRWRRLRELCQGFCISCCRSSTDTDRVRRRRPPPTARHVDFAASSYFFHPLFTLVILALTITSLSVILLQVMGFRHWAFIEYPSLSTALWRNWAHMSWYTRFGDDICSACNCSWNGLGISSLIVFDELKFEMCISIDG